MSPDRVMWGADYPHPEGTVPFTSAALRATFASIDDDVCRAILSENAAAVYGFDLEALAPVAERIGPRVDEVHTPLETYPDGSLLPFYMDDLHPDAGQICGFTGAVKAVANTYSG